MKHFPAELENTRQQKRTRESLVTRGSQSKICKLEDQGSEISKLNLLELSDHHRQSARTLVKEENRLKVCCLL